MVADGMWAEPAKRQPITDRRGERSILDPAPPARLEHPHSKPRQNGCENARGTRSRGCEGIRVYLLPEAIVSGRVTYNGPAEPMLQFVIGSWPSSQQHRLRPICSFMLKGSVTRPLHRGGQWRSDGLMGDWLLESNSQQANCHNLISRLRSPLSFGAHLPTRTPAIPPGRQTVNAYVSSYPTHRRGWEVMVRS